MPRPGVPLQRVEQAVDQVIASYAAAPPAAPELARARTQLVAGAIYRRDSQYAMATAYGQALAIGLTIADVNQWPDRIKAVSAADVKAAAATRLVKKEAVTLYLSPGHG